MTSSKTVSVSGRLVALAVLLGLGSLLASCGGSGGSASNSGPPPVAVASCTNGGASTSSKLMVGTGSNAAAILSCSQGLPALAAPTTGSCIPVIVDSGPCGYGVPFGSASGTAPSVFVVGSANIAFTTVTVCAPHGGACQVIDHVMVDTGSQGLRIMASVLNPSIASALPALPFSPGPLIECVRLADGYSRGSVRTADVHMAGEVATAIPVQVIGDSAAYPVPAGCTGTATTALNDVVSFGANGVLGLGLFAQDCGPNCASGTTPGAANGFYYTCTSTAAGGCVGAGVTLAQQTTNPVSAFTDNNGVLIQLPSVAVTSPATNVMGTIELGINTNATNQATASGLHAYTADDFGNFNSALTSSTGGYTVSTTNYNNSFIDSGSNGFYLPGTSIPTDPTYGWFIPVVSGSSTSPANVLTLTATQQGSVFATSLPTGYINNLTFNVANANTVLFTTNATAFNGLAASSTTTGTISLGGVDWGLPFFYGRPVFVGLEGTSITLGGTTSTGPFWAY